jgi:hypothetical protein
MATRTITLVGFLIGALTSYPVTVAAERAKFRRTRATRWDERKLDTYIAYMSCIKKMHRAAMEAARARDNGEDAAEAVARTEANEDERSVLFGTFVLPADESAAAAAHTVNQRTWDLSTRARDPSNGLHAMRAVALVQALNTPHEAARMDLAITRTGPLG